MLKLVESSAPAKLLTAVGFSCSANAADELAADGDSGRFPARTNTLSILAVSSSTLSVIPVAMSKGVPVLPMKKSEGMGTTLSGRRVNKSPYSYWRLASDSAVIDTHIAT